MELSGVQSVRLAGGFLPSLPPLPSISKASGPFPIDHARARADAEATIASIDFSKRDIVLWIPGSGAVGVHPDFEDAVLREWPDGRVSLSALRYEASWHMRRSVATGIETLRLVLAEIRRRGGDHHVMLAGESQGAWVISEALADPSLRSTVDRALLMGHPWLARHQYLDGRDPNVRVLNNPGDMVTLPINGDPGKGLDALVAIYTLQLAKLPQIVSAVIQNPLHAVKLLSSIQFALPFVKGLRPNPHRYESNFPAGLKFLRQSSATPIEHSSVAAAAMAAAALSRIRLVPASNA